MLLACQRCHRQYDVGDLEPGRSVRCTCGELNPVPRARPRQRAMAHCGHCGGKLEPGAKRCEYCRARVTLAEEGLGTACPECFALLPAKARFCPGCGVELKPAAVLQAIARSSCPRCNERLSATEGKDDPFHQCTSCGGIWLSRKAFQRFVDRALAKEPLPEERRSVAAEVGRRRGNRGPHPRVRCPVCRIWMLVQEFESYSGVMVDRCLQHGWWFDAGELERVGRFLARGGLDEVRRRRAARARSHRMVRAWRRRCAQERRGDEFLASIFGLLLDGED